MKKKIIIIMSVIALCFGLIGCSEYTNMSATENSNISIWTDEETGVQYIIFHDNYKGGITPRLNADGSLYVESEE
jgi:hypothetical protein